MTGHRPFSELTNSFSPERKARVAAKAAALREEMSLEALRKAHQAGALEGQQDLLQVGLGEAGALGDVAHGGGTRLVGVQREREQCTAGVVASGRHLHAGNCRASTV